MKHPLLGLVVAALPFAALAQQADTDQLDVVTVTAHPLADDGIAQAAHVLDDEALQQALASNVAATIAGTPGVHLADFGAAAGRPIIRGLGGPRVRMLQDRIDTLDVSVTSADHAVTIDAFVAERIEILKGPSTLLFGSGAIGGVVNVATNRIPHVVPDDPFAARIELRRNDNGDQTTAALALDGGTGKFAWHIDAFDRSADPFDIPGFAESEGQRAREAAEEGGAEEEEEEEEAFGVLPGSQLDADGFAIGGSYVGERITAGISINTFNGLYGLPGGHPPEGEEEGGEEEEEEEGNPILDMEQQRIDLDVDIKDPFGGFSLLTFRVGFNDYEHQEIEPSGEVATNFENDAYDARVELAYGAADGWDSIVGLQLTDREFSAIGEEAFVPPVDTVSQAVFWLTDRDFDEFSLEFGARLEQVEHESATGLTRDFSAYGLSAGLIKPLNDTVRLAFTADIASRAPVAEELFSNGPHLATRAFEIGDPDLDEERAFSLSGTINVELERFDLTATLYYNDFSGFIYETATGGVEDGLPVFQFVQDDAEVYGVDIGAGFALTETLRLVGSLDFVEAQLDVTTGNNNLPRLPPLSVSLGLEFDDGPLSAALSYRNVASQDNTTDFELPTDSFSNLDLYVGYQWEVSGSTVDLFARGTNLTDDEQRHHSSFIKEFAPRRGRTVELGVRLAF